MTDAPRPASPDCVYATDEAAKRRVYLVMGVCGCGKTTLGQDLATALMLPFYDADGFHPPANVAKMRGGSPLDDDDRRPWLLSLASHIDVWTRQGGAVLACSALKRSYRSLLGSPHNFVMIFLDASRATLQARLASRKGHYMPPSLLDSQLATLEPPVESEQAELIVVPPTVAAGTPSDVLAYVRTRLRPTASRSVLCEAIATCVRCPGVSAFA